MSDVHQSFPQRSGAGSDQPRVSEVHHHQTLLIRKISGFVSSSNYREQTDEAILSTLHLIGEEAAKHVQDFQAERGSIIDHAQTE